MKTAAIVINWIGFAYNLFSLIAVIVLGIIFTAFPSIIVSIIDTSGDSANIANLIVTITVFGTVFLIAGILPLVVSIIVRLYTNKKLNTATSKSELLVPAILSLVLTSFITGILIFCIRDEDLY